jgi:hypothetical protein
MFVHTKQSLDLPSVVLATGAFGDVKNYDGRHFYVSWYPAGLVAEGTDIEPPTVQAWPLRSRLISAVQGGLSPLVPRVAEVFEHADDIIIGGGWVFAQGRGSLNDPTSTLHRRDQFGITRVGTYVSADTGKYSTAPWLARQIAAALAG